MSRQTGDGQSASAAWGERVSSKRTVAMKLKLIGYWVATAAIALETRAGRGDGSGAWGNRAGGRSAGRSDRGPRGLPSVRAHDPGCVETAWRDHLGFSLGFLGGSEWAYAGIFFAPDRCACLGHRAWWGPGNHHLVAPHPRRSRGRFVGAAPAGSDPGRPLSRTNARVRYIGARSSTKSEWESTRRPHRTDLFKTGRCMDGGERGSRRDVLLLPRCWET